MCALYNTYYVMPKGMSQDEVMSNSEKIKPNSLSRYQVTLA